MGKGRITISAELLEQMMLLPEGMSIVAVKAADLDTAGPRCVAFLAEHPDIMETAAGDEYPDIEIHYAAEYVGCGRLIPVAVPRLDEWRVVEKLAGYTGPWAVGEKQEEQCQNQDAVNHEMTS